MQIIGHRGSAGTAPENTLLSIEVALEAGAPWVEIDVRLVCDELLVIHDETVERTTSGKGSIYAMTRTEIAALDAGRAQTIPNLKDVLNTIRARASLNVELKDIASMEPSLAMLDESLRENPCWHERLMVSTFEQSIHSAIARSLPNGALFGVLLNEVPEDAAEYAADLGAYSLNLSYAQLTPTLVAQAHANGLKVFVYTVNEQTHIDRCVGIGVDAIYTDYPARTLAYFNSTM